jgi:hypothetical protein
MVNMVGNSRQTSSNKMSKCNWTNELVNDLIDLVKEIEVIWNAKAKVYQWSKNFVKESFDKVF